ncbi:hypothetical protein EDB19DRAFT_1907563 [Suillus lakei]|nr:hypothetical protein EDB19DRAFT_1907563 [Suillus lakei]
MDNVGLNDQDDSNNDMDVFHNDQDDSNNDTSISKYEIDWATLTIAHAMVNPMNVDWDVDWYGDKVKLSHPNWDGSATGEPERLKKYFPEAVLGKILVPTTIVDRNSKIIVIYLPNILSPSRLKKKSWRDDGYLVPEGGGEFGAGRITIAPAYFMQRQERLVDPLVTSESYSSGKVQDWLAALRTSEVLWNVITATVAPDLFQAGVSSFSEVIKEFDRTAMVMTNGMELEGGEGVPQDDPELCLEEADGLNFPSIEDPEEDSILDLEGEVDSPAEVAEVWMPSWAATDTVMNDVIMALHQEELELLGEASSSLG